VSDAQRVGYTREGACSPALPPHVGKGGEKQVAGRGLGGGVSQPLRTGRVQVIYRPKGGARRGTRRGERGAATSRDLSNRVIEGTGCWRRRRLRLSPLFDVKRETYDSASS